MRPAELLRRYDLLPKKSWGQNFLVDANALQQIVAACQLAPGELVVEIGPGLGALTTALLAADAFVVAIERDRDMARVLRGELGHEPRLVLVEDNALTVDYAALAEAHAPPGIVPPGGFVVVGNLPYHLSTPLLGKLLDARAAVRSIVVMLQSEVADRLLAQPGERNYSALSIGIQLHADVERVVKVGPHAFHPPPKVSSQVVRLNVRHSPRVAMTTPEEALFSQLVRAAFQQRRKTLRNALRAVPNLDVDGSLARVAIDPMRRGETLSIDEFAALARGAKSR